MVRLAIKSKSPDGLVVMLLPTSFERNALSNEPDTSVNNSDSCSLPSEFERELHFKKA